MKASGRPRGKYSQAYRLVKMLEMFKSRRYVTLQMLVDEFQISRRTAHRDLGTLQESYSIEDAGWLENGQKAWQLSGPRSGEIIKLSVMEMAALFMGKNLFNFTRGTELKKSIDSLFQKVSHRLASNRSNYSQRLESKFYCTPGAPKNYEKVDDQLNELVTGLLEEQVVKIEYRRPSGTPYSDTIHPWTLVIHNHALYLIAWSQHSQGVRTFAVERIREAEWQRGMAFKYPVDYTPSEYLSQAFGITVGQPVEVRLRIQPEILEYFRNRQWHPSQVIERQDNSAGVVRLAVPLSQELVSWLLSFGDKIEVIDPPMLRNQLRTVATRLLNQYSDENPG